MKPKDMLGHVRITRAPSPEWIGVEGPLRHKLTSEPMIAEGMLVFGAVESPFPQLTGGAFFPVDPEGDPQWDFEPARYPGGSWKYFASNTGEYARGARGSSPRDYPTLCANNADRLIAMLRAIANAHGDDVVQEAFEETLPP